MSHFTNEVCFNVISMMWEFHRVGDGTILMSMQQRSPVIWIITFEGIAEPMKLYSTWLHHQIKLMASIFTYHDSTAGNAGCKSKWLCNILITVPQSNHNDSLPNILRNVILILIIINAWTKMLIHSKKSHRVMPQYTPSDNRYLGVSALLTDLVQVAITSFCLATKQNI